MVSDALLNYWSGVAAAAAVTFVTAPLSIQSRTVWDLILTAALWFVVSGLAAYAASVISGVKEDVALAVTGSLDQDERAEMRRFAYNTVKVRVRWLLGLDIAVALVAVFISVGGFGA